MPASLSFSTWNIHGLSSSVLGDKTKIKDFTNNIIDTDFMFLTETWSDKEITIPGFKAFVSDPATPHTDRACRLSGGITLLVNLKHEKYVSIEKKSKNYIWCKVSKDLFNNNKDLFLCGAYIPPEKSQYFDQEIFDELENDIINFLSKGNAILLGDLNARTSTLEDSVPQDGNNYINDLRYNSLQPKNRLNFDNTTNRHGLQLINTCKNTDLRILNGRTKGDSLGRPTFHGRNGTSTVDYAICDQETFQNINHFVVKPPTYLSDHSQIIAWVDINKSLPESGTNVPKPEQTPLHKLPPQFEWSESSKINFRQTLKSTEIQRKLDNFIQSTFTDDEKGVNNCVTEFQNILTDAAKKSLKIRKKKTRRKINNPMNKKWFDKECRFKRHELRKLANQKHRDPTNLAIRETYHNALKTYKETLKRKREQFQNDKLTELEKATKENPDSFWKTLRNTSDEEMNDNDPNITPKGDDWLDHFSKLHDNPKLTKEHETIVKNLDEKEKHRDKNITLDTEITESEIMKIATKLKLKKAAYSDKIKNEMIKSSVDILIKGFAKLFNIIIKSGKFPKLWCEGLITSIFKSGNKLDPNNYRGICVSSSLGKFFSLILNNRLISFTEQEKIIHHSQIGFMPGNRTADHILTLKTIHDKYIKQHNKEKIYACFVDFKKAFDSIWHDGLFLKLLENKIGGRFYDLIKDLYTNTKCAVKISDHRTPFFSYRKGVRQGCVLRPLLFNLYINELPLLFEKTSSDPFILPNNITINSLLYADDLVILSRSKTGLQNCLDVLHKWSEKWLLEVNLKKTKIMIMQKHKSKPKNIQFHIGENPIPITDEYTYLGLKLTPNTKFDTASQQLSEKAIHAMYKIRKQIDFHQLPPKLACKIFDSVISPILLYNSEVWGAYSIGDFAKWDKTSAEKAHLKFCKIYLGVNRKASNAASRGELGKFPLLFPIIKRTLGYVMNLQKRPETSIAKLAFLSSKELYLKGKESFYSNIVNFLKKHFPTLIEPIDLEKFLTDTKINTIMETIQNNYISEWKQQIENSTKLSFYGKFKKQYQLEDYLNYIKNPSTRRTYTKFRISNHKLLIEYGRYQQIPREERICKHCDSGSVENEFHFAFECQKYQNLRENSNNILKNIFKMQLTARSKEDLLTYVMGNNDQVLANLFSNFISKCFTIRDK
jgi:hypothetical protein